MRIRSAFGWLMFTVAIVCVAVFPFTVTLAYFSGGWQSLAPLALAFGAGAGAGMGIATATLFPEGKEDHGSTASPVQRHPSGEP